MISLQRIVPFAVIQLSDDETCAGVTGAGARLRQRLQPNPSMLFRSPEATCDCSSRRALDDYARIVDVEFIGHLLLWLFEAVRPDSCDLDLTRPRATLSLLLSIWLSRRC